MTMKRYAALFFAGLFLLIPLACDGPDNCGDPETIELTIDNNGETVKMDLDDEVKVSVRTRIAQGYTWVTELAEGGIIVQVGESVLDGSCGDFAAPGCEEMETFTFQAAGPGIGAIRLKCFRAWDPEADPIETFDAKIIASGS